MTEDESAMDPRGILHDILESIPLRVFWKDRESRYLGCNTLFALDAGVERPDQVIGRLDFELGWRDQAAAYRADDQQVMSLGTPKLGYVEEQPHGKDQRTWLRTSKVPLRGADGEVYGVLGIYEDITEQKTVADRLRATQSAQQQAEVAFQASERRFRDLFESSPDPCWLIDEHNRFVLCNQAAARELGYASIQDVLDTHPSDLSPATQPDGLGSFTKANLMMAAAHQQGVHRFDWVHRRRDGTEFPVEVTLAEITMADRRMLYCIWRDISERLRAHQALQRSEQKYRGIFDESVAAIFVFDRDKRCVDANQAGLDLIGYTREQALGMHMTDVDVDLDVAHAGQQLLLAGKRLINFSHRLRRKDGRIVTVLNNSRPLTGEDGAVVGMQSTLIDVTALQAAQEQQARLQAQLHEAQKLESIGRLAGGVAHDFNNMLSIILGRTSLAMEQLATDDPLHAELKDVLDAAERSADLTRQLLAFARRQTTTPIVLDLNRKLESMLLMLARLVGEDVDLCWAPGAEVRPVRMDPSQVDQILANLCANARDAMTGPGQVRISTANVEVPAAASAPQGLPPGRYVQLSFSDNGVGMTPEVQANVFEPFFTTKAIGKGTGLGLATVYGIVKQNRGHVEVSSRPGEGTTFRILLPACASLDEPSGQRDANADLPRGDETLLLVEDEPAVLQLAREMLTPLGYTILSAASPQEALQFAAPPQGRIDLLVTDVVMPGMGGGELAQRMLALRPGLRLLFISGYPAAMSARDGALAEGVHFLPKPYRQADLAKKVREVLDAPPP